MSQLTARRLVVLALLAPLLFGALWLLWYLSLPPSGAEPAIPARATVSPGPAPGRERPSATPGPGEPPAPTPAGEPATPEQSPSASQPPAPTQGAPVFPGPALPTLVPTPTPPLATPAPTSSAPPPAIALPPGPAAPPVSDQRPQRAATQPVLTPITVAAGDTLAAIAARHGVTVDDIVRANGLPGADQLQVGQKLVVPIPDDRVGPAAWLLPDSALVYGPESIGFDVQAFAQSQPGYLKADLETVEDRVTMTGPQIVQLVAQRYSVDPRLLLAVLEYRGNWLSNSAPVDPALSYPAGKLDQNYKGLFQQLSWVANRLNEGYYGWKGRELTTVDFGDRSQAYLAAGLNPGTAGVQSFLALESNWTDWNTALGPTGLLRTYTQLFGNPFDRDVQLLPPDLTQPAMRLPWAAGEGWYLTGGPHGGWGSGSAWAALDFVGDPQPFGCGISPYWVHAVAPGLVLRSDNGEVVVDLDGDGYEQTGWVVLYMHMADDGRVAAGTVAQAGDPIGHPSCTGGYSTGAHLHIARRYNGEWLPAGSGPAPFVLGGWTSVGSDSEYNGYLTRAGVNVQACVCRVGNQIVADP